jgi:hypothetical protein
MQLLKNVTLELAKDELFIKAPERRGGVHHLSTRDPAVVAEFKRLLNLINGGKHAD